MKEKVGIGIIGCGAIAERQLVALKEVKYASLIGTADINEDRAKELAQRYNAKSYYKNYLDLLKREDLDAVFICTPNFLHAENTIRAAEAGKHILVQKPFALTLEEAEKMIEAAEVNKVKLMPCLFLRFMPSYVKVKELIHQEVIGRPLIYKTHFSHGGIYKYWHPYSDWFYEPEKSGGGVLGDLGSHHFDLLRWLSGSEVCEIWAETNTLTEEIRVEDYATVSLKFKNGSVAQLFFSFCTTIPLGTNIHRVEIYGTAGTIFAAPSTLERPPIRIFTEKTLPENLRGWVDLRVIEENPFTRLEQYFVDCIRNDQEPAISGCNGRKCLEITLAAYKSAKEGKKILL